MANLTHSNDINCYIITNQSPISIYKHLQEDVHRHIFTTVFLLAGLPVAHPISGVDIDIHLVLKKWNTYGAKI